MTYEIDHLSTIDALRKIAAAQRVGAGEMARAVLAALREMRSSLARHRRELRIRSQEVAEVHCGAFGGFI